MPVLERPREVIETFAARRKAAQLQQLRFNLRCEKDAYARMCIKRVIRNMAEGTNRW